MNFGTLMICLDRLKDLRLIGLDCWKRLENGNFYCCLNVVDSQMIKSASYHLNKVYSMFYTETFIRCINYYRFFFSTKKLATSVCSKFIDCSLARCSKVTKHAETETFSTNFSLRSSLTPLTICLKSP